MIASFIITFREVLEAALIVGIVLAYLIRINQKKYNKLVYFAIFSAIIASIIFAVIFQKFAGGFTGRAEQIFEGSTMIFASLLLTTMIIWMMKQKHVVAELHKKVFTEISEKHRIGLFLLVFFAVLREGVETVIFLAATVIVGGYNFAWAIAGGITAILLGYLIFITAIKIDLKKFFLVTSILLILFSAGLVAHGVHEFQEAKILPTYIEHVWDINPPQNPDGSYPALHENGSVGSILKSLFGYNGNPSLLEVLAYIAYLILILFLWRNIEKVHKVI